MSFRVQIRVTLVLPLCPSRAIARTTFRMTRKSPRPSKIPYGGFFPVRLQGQHIDESFCKFAQLSLLPAYGRSSAGCFYPSHAFTTEVRPTFAFIIFSAYAFHAKAAFRRMFGGLSLPRNSTNVDSSCKNGGIESSLSRHYVPFMTDNVIGLTLRFCQNADRFTHHKGTP